MALNEIDRDRDRALDRAYGAAVREEPPAHLDARILAAAHREAGARPRALGSRLRNWRLPISIAAVVVVSVSLVSLVREEGGDYLVHPGAPASRPAEGPAPQSQPRPDASPPASSPRRGPAPAQGAPVPDQIPGDRSPGGSVSSAIPPGERAAERANRQAPETLAKLGDPERARPAEPPPVARERGEGPKAAERRASRAETPAGAADSRAGVRREEAQPQAPALSRTDPPAGSQAEDQQGPAAEIATAPRTPAAPAAKARPEPHPGSPELAALLKEYDARPARDWLGRIQELKKTGRTDLAYGMLDEFKQRYPDYSLPPGLQEDHDRSR